MICDSLRRHLPFWGARFLTMSKQLDCTALNTPNLNKARYISAKKGINDLCGIMTQESATDVVLKPGEAVCPRGCVGFHL